MQQREKPIAKHSFILNPKDNGGESIAINTELFENGDAKHGLEPGFFMNQSITMHSYHNSCSINLSGTSITSDSLRKLADELDKFLIVEKAKYLALFPEKQ